MNDNTAITDATNYLVCKGNLVVPVNDKERENIERVINGESARLIEVRDRMIATDAILYVIPAGDYEEILMGQRGYVRCPVGKHWMKRFATRCSETTTQADGGSCYYG